MRNVTEEFDARGEDGSSYRVQICGGPLIDISPGEVAGSMQSSLKEAYLSDGRALNIIDERQFEIVETGERIVRGS